MQPDLLRSILRFIRDPRTAQQQLRVTVLQLVRELARTRARTASRENTSRSNDTPKQYWEP